MRKKRLVIPKLPQLIKVVSHNKIDIFKSKEDRLFFCNLMSEYLSKYDVLIYGFSLPNNECYFIIYSDFPDLPPRYIQLLLKSYTHFFNKKYQRSGTIWNGRYHNMPFEFNKYFIPVLSYIESRSSREEAYRCSYDFHVGHEDKKEILSILNGNFSKDQKEKYNYMLLNYSKSYNLDNNDFFKNKIDTCIKQNCLLASVDFLKKIEKYEQKDLGYHSVGRPRKDKTHLSIKENVLDFERRCEIYFHKYGYQKLNLKFLDNNGKLYYDGTSSLISLAENKKLNNDVYVKCWYQYEFFNYENNILNEYYECGSEIIGKSSVLDEVEQISLYLDILSRFGLSSYVHLHINNVGDLATLITYRESLVKYFRPYENLFNDEEVLLLNRTPEELLFNKSNKLKDLIKNAPGILQYIDNDSYCLFELFQKLLTDFNISFVIDKNLRVIKNKNKNKIQYNNNVFCFYYGDDVLCCGGNYTINNLTAFGGSLKTEKIIALSQEIIKYKEPLSITVLSFSKNHFDSLKLCGELRERYKDLIVKHHPIKKRKKVESFFKEINDRFIFVIDERNGDYYLYDSFSKEKINNEIFNYLSSQIFF